jgi:hypothetical protein
VLVGLRRTVRVKVLMAILLRHTVVLMHTIGGTVRWLVAVVALRLLLWGLTVHSEGVLVEMGKIVG